MEGKGEGKRERERETERDRERQRERERERERERARHLSIICTSVHTLNRKPLVICKSKLAKIQSRA